ncbi:MAG: methylamine dehydrogenase (amicyanin) light chain [Deltaproteobacteria bacterium]|nr:methylamine dehydrogenase (amicyanin) light chain [Deltaproteobacteria bacterium]MBW2421179.1 methylamine dehydrogenase (amicyanin) light chain [Deltaproteobacteria bacterium]
MSRLDRWAEHSARGLARSAGRRSFLARLGRFLLAAAGVSLLPVLPVARAEGGAAQTLPGEVEGPEGDPSKCEYWRYCAIDGFLCECCGGSATACPPGSELSPVTWVGTCRNPADGKDYLISYNDCCGKGLCGRCVCNRNEGDRPDYHWYRSNDINWCAGTSSQSYHCSIAVVLGPAKERQPER